MRHQTIHDTVTIERRYAARIERVCRAHADPKKTCRRLGQYPLESLESLAEELESHG